jgi:hypothetical protein
MGKRKRKVDRSPGWRSRRAIKWFEDYLHIPEGVHVGEPLKVAEFMPTAQSAMATCCQS